MFKNSKLSRCLLLQVFTGNINYIWISYFPSSAKFNKVSEWVVRFNRKLLAVISRRKPAESATTQNEYLFKTACLLFLFLLTSNYFLWLIGKLPRNNQNGGILVIVNIHDINISKTRKVSWKNKLSFPKFINSNFLCNLETLLTARYISSDSQFFSFFF